MRMRIDMKRLFASVILIGLAFAVAACNLPAPAPDKNESATQTFIAQAAAQIVNSTPTISPTPENTATPTATLDPIFQAQTAQALLALTASPTPTITVNPGTYVLQAGEYPWCIARRFNVDPKELLRVNGLSSGLVYEPGLKLTIPQGTGGFPAPRALNPHPTTYTVPQSNMTVYAVACYFGDVDPNAILQANALTSPILALGTVLKIP